MELTLEQVAAALDLPIETVERWVRQGRIPFQRQQGEIHFRQRVLEKWALHRKLPFQVVSKPARTTDTCQTDSIHVAMRRGGVHFDIEGTDAESALRNAVQGLESLALNPAQRDLLLQHLMEREAMASTGVGKGVAIPHPRTPLEDGVPCPTICTFFLKRAIPFRAVDDKPVFLLFLLLSPSINAHLHCLSRLAYCVRDDAFVAFLQTRPSPEALLGQVATIEAQLDSH